MKSPFFNVPTYHLENEEERNYVFSNIGNMVIKRTSNPVVMVCWWAIKPPDKEVDDFKTAIPAESPVSFIAQPIIKLSNCTLFD